MCPVKVWMIHLTVGLLLEITYQQVRTQVIGYTREEHVRYARFGVVIALPPNRQPIPIVPAGPSPHFARN